MAECEESENIQREATEEEKRLKYFKFVPTAVDYIVVSLSNLYVFAKDNCPLKLAVEAVEYTVNCTVTPIYHQYCNVSNGALKFADSTVDVSISYVSSVVEQVSTQAYSVVGDAPEVVRVVIESTKTLYTNYESTAKEFFSTDDSKVEEYAVTAWRGLNKLPLFPQVANVVAPTASYCCEMYNQTVRSASEQGYSAFSYLPLVPTERIAQVFGDEAP
ncbi:hypothetical protein P3X46_034951 [Hevea brasiliensis]|uniref:Small rubber particle protein n=1 Tax=Hevea brasiliensis TaxID=3981 RepID=A0ABQ9KA10_HEVBR|nr:small rubber particle protein-like [Hevea brasiliensis]KAJ9128496.1 hypothetical protein P3X46_034951 [Hevea brasiliensis]